MTERERAGRKMVFGAATIILLTMLYATCHGQSCGKTANFVVCGPAPLNQQVADAAEAARAKWAQAWFGKTFPDWSQPAKVTIRPNNTDGGGATHFVFDRGEVFGWECNWEGKPERLVGTVVPHEVTHMLMASYFRRPLPRWLDEGCAVLAEPEIGRTNWKRRTINWIPLSRLLSMTEYPWSQQRVADLYSESTALAEFIVWHCGYYAPPAIAERYFETKDWDASFRHFMGHDVASLETAFRSWVERGRPLPPGGTQARYAWLPNGWAPRQSTQVAKLPLVPVLPVKSATGRPVVGGLSSPGRSGEGLREIRTVRGPLTDRWNQWFGSGSAPGTTTPGPTYSDSTATTTAPQWHAPAATVQTAVPDQVYTELANMRQEVANLRAQGKEVPTDVANRLLSMESRLAKQIEENRSEVQKQGTAIQASTSKSEGRLKWWLGIISSGAGLVVAYFLGGPAGAGLWGVKKVGTALVEDLKRYKESEGKDPTYGMEWAATTPGKLDDIIMKWLSDFGVARLDDVEQIKNKIVGELDKRVKQRNSQQSRGLRGMLKQALRAQPPTAGATK